MNSFVYKEKKSIWNPHNFDLELTLDLKKIDSSAYSVSIQTYYSTKLNDKFDLLLDYNISGQPSKKLMRYFYQSCFNSYKSKIANKAKYIVDMKTGTDMKKA